MAPIPAIIGNNAIHGTNHINGPGIAHKPIVLEWLAVHFKINGERALENVGIRTEAATLRIVSGLIVCFL